MQKKDHKQLYLGLMNGERGKKGDWSVVWLISLLHRQVWSVLGSESKADGVGWARGIQEHSAEMLQRGEFSVCEGLIKGSFRSFWWEMSFSLNFWRYFIESHHDTSRKELPQQSYHRKFIQILFPHRMDLIFKSSSHHWPKRARRKLSKISYPTSQHLSAKQVRIPLLSLHSSLPPSHLCTFLHLHFTMPLFAIPLHQLREL
jgi:hypothetical protein